MIKKEEFIEKAKQVHGDKYDYSKVNYKKVTDKISIICPIHGEFLMEARAHYRGQGCPKCGIESRVKKKTLSKEEFVKRAKEKFGDFYNFESINYINTKTPIKITCKEHGESYITPHDMFSHKYPCPKCGNKDKGLSSKLSNEEFIKRLKNLYEEKYDYSLVNYINNSTKVSVICKKHGIFKTRPYSILEGHGCPKCSNERQSERQTKDTNWFINRAKEIHGDRYDYSKTVYKNIKSSLTITCKEHGDFVQIPSYHLNGCGCQKCGMSVSNQEIEIYNFCKTISKTAEQSNRSVIYPYEIDIYIPDLKIGIEYNGLYWHSNAVINKNYHLKKLELAKSKGIKLIQIFEDEYINNKELVLKKIRHILGYDNVSEKIAARKCEIKEIEIKDAKDFLTINHIQGFSPSTLHIGAYFKDKLIAVMSFKRKTNNSDKWELTRFASDNSVICQGVGGKLLNYFIKKYNPSYIKSFADRRWTINEENNMYVKIGFKFDGYTSPDYKYFKPSDGIKRQHKFGFRKQILHRKYNLPLSMTEREMTEKLGYKKIYDCGLIRYVWKKEKADN